MIRHIFRLMWHRKRHNVLIGLEIFISYLVLLGVMVIGVSYATFYRYPLGYDIDRVWRVGIRSDFRNDRDEDKAAGRQAVQQVLLALHDLPQVEVRRGCLHRAVRERELGIGHQRPWAEVRLRRERGHRSVSRRHRSETGVGPLVQPRGRWRVVGSGDPQPAARPRHVRERKPCWSGVPEGSRAGRQGHVARRSRARGAGNACRRHHRRLPAARRAVAAGTLHVPSHATGRSHEGRPARTPLEGPSRHHRGFRRDTRQEDAGRRARLVF